MANYFKFPDVGEGITEGTLLKWLVKEGQEVKHDQNIAEIETAKAIVQIPSPYAGNVLKLYYKVGDTVKVGTNLIAIGNKGDKLEEAVESKKVAMKEVARENVSNADNVLATPRTRRIAISLGVDISNVKGTGPNGRVTDEDVENFKKGGKDVSKESSVPKINFEKFGAVKREKLSQARKTMLEHMVLSKNIIPHACIMDEADVTVLYGLRKKKKADAEKKGISLTYLPFVVKAVADALKKHPYLNASYDDASEEVVFKKYYNIGIAVDSEQGLFVPVVKNADGKKLLDIAKEMGELADKVRERKILLDDLQGSSFSITNVGAVGALLSVPVINYPDVAILAMHKIADKAAVVDGKVVVRKILPLSLAFDHRVVDGGSATRFLNDVIKNLSELK